MNYNLDLSFIYIYVCLCVTKSLYLSRKQICFGTIKLGENNIVLVLFITIYIILKISDSDTTRSNLYVKYEANHVV